MNSTTDTANENFITDQGAIRLRFSRARRGPRAAAEETVERAERTASDTRAAPTAAEPLGPPGRCCCLEPPCWAGPAGAPAGRCCPAPGLAAGADPGRPEVAPGAAPL